MNDPGAASEFEFAALREAANYRAALLAEFAPHLRGRVAEIGAGVGQFTRLLQAQSAIRELVAVEPEARFCHELRAALPNVGILQGTAAALAPGSSWHAIVSVNVLEHIQEDQAELGCYRALLAPERGVLCLFVPARPELYSLIDRDFGHWRRYTRPELRRKLLAAGLVPLRLDYFNLVGYFAWWLHFRLLRRRAFKWSSVRWFDRAIFPLVHRFESCVCRPPMGQSLLAIAQAQ